MARKFDSHLFDGIKAAFANLLWDDRREVFTVRRGVEGAGFSIEPPMASIIEVVTDNTYICEAPAGTSASEPSWRCQRVNVTAGVTTITWAGGGAFNQVAANRTGLTYS